MICPLPQMFTLAQSQIIGPSLLVFDSTQTSQICLFTQIPLSTQLTGLTDLDNFSKIILLWSKNDPISNCIFCSVRTIPLQIIYFN